MLYVYETINNTSEALVQRLPITYHLISIEAYHFMLDRSDAYLFVTNVASNNGIRDSDFHFQEKRLYLG